MNKTTTRTVRPTGGRAVARNAKPTGGKAVMRSTTKKSTARSTGRMGRKSK